MTDQIALGTVIGGYRIERRLGSGGMGSVYLAKHPELPRYDALKILNPGYEADDSFRKRFLREAELASRLDHSNIVTIYNRGSQDALLWIAMQYVQGDDCSVLLKRSPSGLDPAEALYIVGQVARGLDYAHKAGLLHRDVKPANILVAKDGDDEGRRVLLTDFGVAKGGDEASQLTVAGTVLATLAYASPEQLCGEELDPRSDQYSLAATFFHLVAGKVPYSGSSTSAVVDAHFNAPPPRLSQIREGIPQAVEAVVSRGLAKSADDRYDSCRDFAKALRAAVTGAPPVGPPRVGAPAPGTPVPKPPVVGGPAGLGSGHPSGPQVPGTPVPSRPRTVAPGVRGQTYRPSQPGVRTSQPLGRSAAQPLGGSTSQPPRVAPRPAAAPLFATGVAPRASAPQPAKVPPIHPGNIHRRPSVPQQQTSLSAGVIVLVVVAVLALLLLVVVLSLA